MDVPPNTLALRALGVTWVIGPRRAFNRLPETIRVRTAGHAMSVLRRFTDDDSEIWRLRKLLDDNPACGISSHRISKQSLIEQIANLFERGLLCLVEVRPIAPASVAALHASLQGISPASEMARAATRKTASGAAAPAPAPLPVTARSALGSKASTPAGARPPVPASTGVRSSAVVERAFSQWSIEERFLEALERTGPKLPARFRAAFAELLTPEVAATVVGTLALIAAAHMIGGVFAAAIDVLLIGIGFTFLGWTAFEAGQQLGRFIYLSATATDVTTLDEAAEALAKVIVLIGVEALLVLLTKAAVKASPKAIARPGESGMNAPKASEPKKPPQQRVASNTGKSEPEVRAKPKGQTELAKIEREQIAKLVQQGRIAEARDILRPLLKNRDLQGVIDRLEVSSQPGKAVFWSGDKAAAEAFASKTGGVTLETTPGGRAVDGWREIQSAFPGWKGEPPPNGFDFWTTLSKKFADGASGDVNVIQTAEKSREGRRRCLEKCRAGNP